MFKLSYITGSSKQKSKASPMKTQISYLRGTRATRTGTAGDASTTAVHAPRRDLYTGRWPPTWADVDCAPHWMKMAAVKAHFFGVTRAQLLTPFFLQDSWAFHGHARPVQDTRKSSCRHTRWRRREGGHTWQKWDEGEGGWAGVVAFSPGAERADVHPVAAADADGDLAAAAAPPRPWRQLRPLPPRTVRMEAPTARSVSRRREAPSRQTTSPPDAVGRFAAVGRAARPRRRRVPSSGEGRPLVRAAKTAGEVGRRRGSCVGVGSAGCVATSTAAAAVAAGPVIEAGRVPRRRRGRCSPPRSCRGRCHGRRFGVFAGGSAPSVRGAPAPELSRAPTPAAAGRRRRRCLVGG